MNKEQFMDACKQINVPIDDEKWHQFQIYADLLVDWNKKMNLTAITQFEEIVEKHFYDSLLAWDCIKMQGHLCDVGAGAGFPSIPLKIACPDLKVTIFEPLNKRCIFLNEVIQVCNLKEVSVLNIRAEQGATQYREQFDIVTARAVANLRVLSELCIPLVKKDGVFVAMKGAQGKQEADEAKNAIAHLGCQLELVKEPTLSDGAKRVNLVYRKIKKTPSQYPRNYSKIKKNPL